MVVRVQDGVPEQAMGGSRLVFAAARATAVLEAGGRREGAR